MTEFFSFAVFRTTLIVLAFVSSYFPSLITESTDASTWTTCKNSLMVLRSSSPLDVYIYIYILYIYIYIYIYILYIYIYIVYKMLRNIHLPPRYFIYLTSSIALLLIKMVMGNFGLLGTWNITNSVFDMLSDRRLMHNYSYNFFNSKFIVFLGSLNFCFQNRYWYHLQRGKISFWKKYFGDH